MNEQKIAYAQLIIKMGIQIKEGDNLIIKTQAHSHEFIELLVKEAYKLGCNKIIVEYTDDKLKRLKYQNEKIENFETLPNYIIEKSDYLVKNNFKFLHVISDDPNIFIDIEQKKISASQKIYQEKCFKQINATMNDENSWCVVAVPSKAWANVVFKDMENKEERLWDAILKATRCDKPNPINNWKNHLEKLNSIANQLNEIQYEELHFTNQLGTNLVIGLPKKHIWSAASSINQTDNSTFVANMPTEEIFTLPDYKKVDGIVYSSKALIYNGDIIDEFYLEFKNGQVVSSGAKRGEHLLKTLLEMDEGASYLGEVALVSNQSPINQANILFYNTLFDENAACHLALGRAYPTCLLDGAGLNIEQLKKRGANYSIIHEDFMFGTSDLKVIATKEKIKTIIFENGEFI